MFVGEIPVLDYLKVIALFLIWAAVGRFIGGEEGMDSWLMLSFGFVSGWVCAYIYHEVYSYRS